MEYAKVTNGQLEAIEKRLDNLLEYNKRQDTTTTKIEKILTGNSNPEKGHATRLVLAESNIKTLFKKFAGFSKFHYAIGVTVIIAVIKIAFF